jgi:hypothetical protein
MVSFLLAFPPKSYMHSSSPHSDYMLCPLIIIRDLFILVIFGKQWMLWSVSLCSFLQRATISSFLSLNIFLSTLFSNTSSLCYSLIVLFSMFFSIKSILVIIFSLSYIYYKFLFIYFTTVFSLPRFSSELFLFYNTHLVYMNTILSHSVLYYCPLVSLLSDSWFAADTVPTVLVRDVINQTMSGYTQYFAE